MTELVLSDVRYAVLARIYGDVNRSYTHKPLLGAMI